MLQLLPEVYIARVTCTRHLWWHTASKRRDLNTASPNTNQTYVDILYHINIHSPIHFHTTCTLSLLMWDTVLRDYITWFSSRSMRHPQEGIALPPLRNTTEKLIIIPLLCKDKKQYYYGYHLGSLYIYFSYERMFITSPTLRMNI